MIEKGKVGAVQLCMIMYPTIIATAILSLPAMAAEKAGRDMWLTPVWAMLAGAAGLLIAIQLNKMYPKETIIEYCDRILGRVFGKLVGFLYLFFYIHISSIILKEYGNFIIGNFYFKTPMLVIVSSFALLCIFTARGGVEVVARTASLVTPIAFIVLVAVLVLIIPDLQPTNMLPIFEHGILPSMKGSFTVQAWYSEFFILSFLLPYMHKREEGMKAGAFTLVAVMLTLVFVNLVSLMLMGVDTKYYNYPLIGVARTISVAGFFQHLESLIMVLWVAGTFVKLSMFLYACTIGTSQWIGLSQYRIMALPVGFLVVLLSVWGQPRLQELDHLFETVIPYYLLMMQIAVPLLLLLIGLMRRPSK
ncbi:Spore germination protein YndE [Paenibacillus plantiphilus]|uniref:Spore germination protein YndE n=1 Tax=Paenibacillus plantiphilus TaxID=2905650 RepID=A0ABN8GGX2_9BACL|nr:endospore germination permease [Paenibacillus plantiphilus]CAH1209028.1 Spore germination protein YndE [Paenibacillus plantiphilus]